MRITILTCLAASLLLVVSSASGQTNQTSTPVPPPDTAEVKQEVQQVEALMPTLPDRGAALFLLAHDHMQLGNTEKALSSLKQCIELDEGFDPDGDGAFRPLKAVPEFQKLVER